MKEFKKATRDEDPISSDDSKSIDSDKRKK
jgi:hypothetical protein